VKVYQGDGFAIMDIGSTIGGITPIEQELYTLGLANVPYGFLGLPRFGALRRPGVLWVPQNDYDTVHAAIAARMMDDPSYPTTLRALYDGTIRQFDAALATYVGGDENTLPALWETLCVAMAYVAFNWLMPRDAFADAVQALTGYSRSQTDQWLLRASIPSYTPHFMQFRRALLSLASNVLDGRPVETDAFARSMGCLQTGGIDATPLEDPDVVMDTARELATELGSAGVAGEIIRIDQARMLSSAARAAAIGAAYAATVARGGDPRRILAIAALLTLAADEEEERHVAQMRGMAALRLAGEWRGVQRHALSAAALGLPVPLPSADTLLATAA